MERITGGFIKYVKCSHFRVHRLADRLHQFYELNTARSEKRAKEVGVRKAVGSGKKTDYQSIPGRILLISGLSFLLSLGISPSLCLTSINSLTKQ